MWAGWGPVASSVSDDPVSASAPAPAPDPVPVFDPDPDPVPVPVPVLDPVPVPVPANGNAMVDPVPSTLNVLLSQLLPFRFRHLKFLFFQSLKLFRFVSELSLIHI